MAGAVLNRGSFLSGLKGAPQRLRKAFAEDVKNVCYECHERILEGTPVWTGEAVANWAWAMNSPNSSYMPLPYIPKMEATNHLPLGSEANRGVATQIANRTFATLSFDNPYQAYWFVNNTEQAPHLIEAADWPELPFHPRGQANLVAITISYVVTQLKAGNL